MIVRQQIGRTPQLNRAFWSFAIIGAARHPLIWSYDELLMLPHRHVRAPIWCTSESMIAPSPANESTWTGVPLTLLLHNTALTATAQFARIHSADGYVTVLPRAALDRAVIATAKDDNPLSIADGFPARLIVPGTVGYKHAKWIERIELTDDPSGGVWESRGGQIDAPLHNAARVTRVSFKDDRFQIEGKLLWQGNRRPMLTVMIDGIESGSLAVTALHRSYDGDLNRGTWHTVWQPPHRGKFTLHVWIDKVKAQSCPSTLLEAT